MWLTVLAVVMVQRKRNALTGEEREIKSAGDSFITLHDVLLEIHHENYGNIIVVFVVR